MTKLQVDPSFQSKPISEHQRLRQVEADHQRVLYAWAQMQFSDEKLALAEQEPEEFTTEEVLKQLGQR